MPNKIQHSASEMITKFKILYFQSFKQYLMNMSVTANIDCQFDWV